MDKIQITGGRQLNGTIKISGAKNAALPEMCAALLTEQKVTLTNVPRLQDVATMRKLLDNMGCETQTIGERGGMTFQAKDTINPEAPYELVKTMRASILALGPLLARFGKATVSLPGGCAIGSRPVDQHIKGLQAMSAQIEVEHGYIKARLPEGQKRLKGARITTDMITVTGTENLMMAACLAEGETILENAAQEPEIIDLAEMLIKMGAKITGHGTHKIHIQGVEKLNGCIHQVVADRIEAGTFLCAVAATGGEVTLQDAKANHMDSVIEKLTAAGVEISSTKDTITIKSKGAQHLKAQNLRTSEYPAFPTDMQAQFMALNCVANGASSVTETIFENRFMHVNELMRLGAQIHIEGKTAMIEGGAKLTGATVMATDLRASACLVIAALVASGETQIERIYHLDRGYDQIEEKLTNLGATIQRIK